MPSSSRKWPDQDRHPVEPQFTKIPEKENSMNDLTNSIDASARQQFERSIDKTSLHRAIAQYKSELNTYLIACREDDETPFTGWDALECLEFWAKPAASKLEAIAALQLAIEFCEVGASDVIPAMMKAVLGFLEGDQVGLDLRQLSSGSTAQ